MAQEDEKKSGPWFMKNIRAQRAYITKRSKTEKEKREAVGEERRRERLTQDATRGRHFPTPEQRRSRGTRAQWKRARANASGSRSTERRR